MWGYRVTHTALALTEGIAMRTACGIDIGGSGIKGALVDLDTGEFIGDRVRIETPQPALPDSVAQVCRQIVDALEVGQDVPVGVTLPAPIVHGVVPFMANLDQTWTGINVDELMTKHLGRPSHALNDADAAGLAEVAYGAAKDVKGTVIVTTLGTGIGSAVVVDGTLVPNTELGHLEIDGHDAETRASSAQKELQDLGWKRWAKRLQRYYSHVEMLFSPDLLVVGGGVSKKHEKFLPLLDLRAPIVPAALLNTAGIVGAAYEAARAVERQG
ncbi:polyphosphate--glucose phosphotransferase [Actinomyces slackii]|uniref:Polyphosphate glucokinase n=2 Tax=Actinomyces slackii TaxID=52774 RepID=A0A3S4SU83_9ACTO|nr:Polyphosphate glucokinase [Actinomyces slackii]